MDKEIAGMNKSIAKDPTSAIDALETHLDKANIVPLDYRKLTPQNQAVFDAHINSLPPARQAQIIIIR